LLTSTGIDPPAAAGTVPVATWLELARVIDAQGEPGISR
jgi:23S rRNA (adenine-N6)-dimethyltransferase